MLHHSYVMLRYIMGVESIREFILQRNCDITLTHDDVIKWKHFLRYWSFARGIPLTNASDVELWWFLGSAPKQTVQRLVIWDAIALIKTSPLCSLDCMRTTFLIQLLHLMDTDVLCFLKNIYLNTLRPRWNGRHFPEDISKLKVSGMKMYEFRWRFHRSLFLMV